MNVPYTTLRGLMKLKYTPSNLLFINIAITYTVVSLTVHPFSMYVLAVQHLQETDRIVVQILCQVQIVSKNIRKISPLSV